MLYRIGCLCVCGCECECACQRNNDETSDRQSWWKWKTENENQITSMQYRTRVTCLISAAFSIHSNKACSLNVFIECSHLKLPKIMSVVVIWTNVVIHIIIGYIAQIPTFYWTVCMSPKPNYFGISVLSTLFAIPFYYLF